MVFHIHNNITQKYYKNYFNVFYVLPHIRYAKIFITKKRNMLEIDKEKNTF